MASVWADDGQLFKMGSPSPGVGLTDSHWRDFGDDDEQLRKKETPSPGEGLQIACGGHLGGGRTVVQEVNSVVWCGAYS